MKEENVYETKTRRRSSGPSFKTKKEPKPIKSSKSQKVDPKMAISFTEDQFQQLITAITSKSGSSFASCNSCFDGTRISEAVETFLASVCLNALKILMMKTHLPDYPYS